MLKLIKAGLCRVKCNKIYHICNFAVIFFILLNLFSDWSAYNNHSDLPVSSFPRHLFDGINRIVISASVFISLYLGTDYKNGTMRNKLAVGNARTRVYISNFIVCFTALLFTLAVSVATVFAFGKLFMPAEFFPEVGKLIPSILVCIPIMAAIAALNVILATLINSSTISAAVAILSAFILLTASLIIHDSLSAPEYVDKEQLESIGISAEENTESGELVENPYYIKGTKRKIYKFVDTILPSSQILTISEDVSNKKIADIACLDMISAIVICGAGCVCFRRKDLK